MYDNLNISVAKNIGKDRLEVIYLRSAITRIIAQTCLQPGLSYVYNELLEFRGDEIYFFKDEKISLVDVFPCNTKNFVYFKDQELIDNNSLLEFYLEKNSAGLFGMEKEGLAFTVKMPLD